jgi:hypothetical protein
MFPSFQREVITRSHLAQDLRRDVSGAGGVKKAPALVAAKSDEVQVAFADDAFEAFGHGQIEEGPTLCKNGKG